MESSATRSLSPLWSSGWWGAWRSPKTWASRDSWGPCGNVPKKQRGILPCPNNSCKPGGKTGSMDTAELPLHADGHLLWCSVGEGLLLLQGMTTIGCCKERKGKVEKTSQTKTVNHKRSFKRPKQKSEHTLSSAFIWTVQSPPPCCPLPLSLRKKNKWTTRAISFDYGSCLLDLCNKLLHPIKGWSWWTPGRTILLASALDRPGCITEAGMPLILSWHDLEMDLKLHIFKKILRGTWLLW